MLGGYATVLEKLARRLTEEGVKTQLGVRVTSVRRELHGIQVSR